jgi:hypothetical protein
MGPDDFAGIGVEAQDPFGGFLTVSIGDVNFAFGDCWAGVTGTDGSSPSRLQLGSIETFDDSGFAPNAIAVWSPPLGPVISEERKRADRDND